MSSPATEHSNRKIAVVDFGGQYAHLIASRLRRLGAYSEIRNPSEFTAAIAKREYSGIVFSGGPASVYAPGAPASRPELIEAGLPLLGICYGHQLLMHQAGGRVSQSASQEFGPARLGLADTRGIFSGEAPSHTIDGPVVWMSHGDEVHELPPGFITLASTEDCRFAAVGDLDRKLFGLQFHPEVKESERGDEYLKAFIKICGLEGSWSLGDFLKDEVEKLREDVGEKKIFFLISGGVDSTVAFALLARALPAEHLVGLFVDTGFMRDREGAEVREALNAVGVQLHTAEAAERYFAELKDVYDPEEKRRIIGELFINVQADEVSRLELNAGEWFLGQGTIYPDTIESGATDHSHKIKTHHNRVAAVEELIKKGRVVEPIRELYKDEVRRLGSLLGLPDSIVLRHPFPGPGLAVRCLCLEKPPEDGDGEREAAAVLGPRVSRTSGDGEAAAIQERLDRAGVAALLLPVYSVGVQGDQRSYARCAVLFPDTAARISAPADLDAWNDALEIARRIPNRFRSLNRVLYCAARADAGTTYPEIQARFPVDLSPERIELLRRADRIVHDFQIEAQIYGEIWQFPTVLVPAGNGAGLGESIVLRPITSTDAMTASVYRMREEHLRSLAERLVALDGVDFVFYDLTSKPPGTIEWE